MTSQPPAQAQTFFSLTPDRVMDAVEAGGLRCTGRCMALNSFENRVYDVELEDGTRRVAKFYRPGRWSEAQVREEHQYLADLVAAEIPAIAPLAFPDGDTLKQMPGAEIRYALFPKVGGRAPDELSPEQLRWIGRLLGRIHSVGAGRKAPGRVTLTPQSYGRENLEFLLGRGFVPMDFEKRYRDAAEKICAIGDRLMGVGTSGFASQRIHGDCHLGNLLWNTQGPFFLDFDDMVNGPAVQDLWLLIPRGSGEERAQALENLLEGYEEMYHFDRRSLKWIELLRALRFIHYSAWLARRWEDPAFPLAFPQFGSHRYWNDETADLERQLELLIACETGNSF